MAHYRHPDEKASETVTFRLTAEEKDRLNQLAKLENRSMTDLIRQLLAEAASQKGLTVSPRQRVQTRPRVQARQTVPTTLTTQTTPTPLPPPTLEQTLKSTHTMTTFADLVERFRDSFKDRAEGTRKELDDTLRLLTGVESEHPPLVNMNTPIKEITPDKLRKVRLDLAETNIRVAKKNLHLTYFRMMLHFAIKQSKGLGLNPVVDLASFTISEMPKAWPGRLR